MRSVWFFISNTIYDRDFTLVPQRLDFTAGQNESEDGPRHSHDNRCDASHLELLFFAGLGMGTTMEVGRDGGGHAVHAAVEAGQGGGDQSCDDRQRQALDPGQHRLGDADVGDHRRTAQRPAGIEPVPRYGAEEGDRQRRGDGDRGGTQNQEGDRGVNSPPLPVQAPLTGLVCELERDCDNDANSDDPEDGACHVQKIVITRHQREAGWRGGLAG